MAPRPYRPKTRDEIARNMSAIRSTGNKTETALRRALHARGLRYRKYRTDLPGRPDIVFPTQRVAVFVDGDYWHCRLCVEGGEPALRAKLQHLSPESREYWFAKFTSRVQRDEQVTAQLRAAGWLVLRFWESDIKKDIAQGVRSIAAAVIRGRARQSASKKQPRSRTHTGRRSALGPAE